MKNLKIAENIFLSAVASVHPEKLIGDQVKLTDSVLSFGSLKISLDTIKNIYIIGAGKATGSMAYAFERILGNRITGGHIVVKYDHSYKLKYVKISEAGHPVPDSNGFKATDEILKISLKANESDLVICLISGGGSSLLADLPEGSTQEELMKLNSLLVSSGANIAEINTVRKHLSKVKGGGLAKSVFPATLVNMILSDVPGDSPEIIASGPTFPDSSTYQNAVEIIRKYNLFSVIPSNLVKYLLDGQLGLLPETPKPGDPVFRKTFNFIIGTNSTALEAARIKAQELGLNTIIADGKIFGEVSKTASYIVETALLYRMNRTGAKPICLLFGGETTIAVSGKGLGGRNQHLALLCAMLLKNESGITILCAGTDGTDGPTDATGAVVNSQTLVNAEEKDENPTIYLTDFNSYNFFRTMGGHIITGPTMTNVMDIIVVIIE